jgi:uncharacterized protein (TIGR00255 family)
MISSMTGFANKTITLTGPSGDKTHISISLKSLNYRFFETTFKIPHPLSYLETRLIELCKKKLTRGHVYLTVYISNPNLFRGAIEPTFNTITNYMTAINTIKSRFGISQDITLDNILRLPDIFTVEETTADNSIETRIIDTINELLDAVIRARSTEGAQLEQDLHKRLAVMQTEIDAIETSTQSLVIAQKEKISRISQAIDADPTSMAKMQQETLYTMLDKIDIHEEIVRFKSHLKDLGEQLRTAEAEKGKRLDFTLQELGREINTISAKCSDAAIGKRAINVKVEIEKAREQVQNIV